MCAISYYFGYVRARGAPSVYPRRESETATLVGARLRLTLSKSLTLY